VTTFSTPKGTQDILPADWPYWNFVIEHAQEVARLFGYLRIETPTLAETSLFSRTTGQATDIVEKEMYSFLDRGGDDVSLRPEGTAPVMRAYLQHGMHRLPQPVKLYYIEHIYRAENPQKGRLREHHQFGCEAIGVEDAFVDVEMVSLLNELYRRIGITGLTLNVNSIGDEACRPIYLQTLTRYLWGDVDQLAETDQLRLERNPLRVLDSKEHKSQRTIAGAPKMLDYLCDACRTHWEKFCRGLEILCVDYLINHRLVRGLDYYTRTVFEFSPQTEGAAQSVVGAGGRYDALSEAMGGPHIPGVGFGSGLERLILNIQEQGADVPKSPVAEVYAAHVGDGTEEASLLISHRLRQSGVATLMSFGPRSLKPQLKAAAGSGARVAVIAFEDELKDGKVVVRELETGDQSAVPFEDATRVLRGEASASGTEL
jgi:histidyl-tRNA synthetase